MGSLRSILLMVALAMLAPVAAFGADRIGQIKVVSGDVNVVRNGVSTPATPGYELFESDVVMTGENSAVGMTFSDNSRMSLGPKSELSLEAYAFSRPGKPNAFDARLKSGSLTAASGRIAKTRPLAMRVLLPTTVLGVKGTVLAARVKAPE